MVNKKYEIDLKIGVTAASNQTWFSEAFKLQVACDANSTNITAPADL